MRSISNATFVLVALLFSFGCSQQGTNVKLEVSNNFVFGGSGTAAIAGGGLMVWGQNSTTGASFGKALVDSDEINVPLPNGAWTFYAMAWDGTKDYSNNNVTNHVFGGTIRCAISSAVLDGKAAAVNLTVNNANCADQAFAGTIGTSGVVNDLKLPAARFNFCRGVAGISSPSQLCTDSHRDNRQAFRKSTVGSFRVTLKNHLSFSGGRSLEADGLKGQCVTFFGDVDSASQGGETVSHSSKYGRATIAVPGLPAGGPNLPFHTEVEMYLTGDCDADPAKARGVFKKDLPNGITSQDNVGNKYVVDGTFHRQYLTLLAATVCDGRTGTDLGDNPFAGGDGTRDNPYIICSVPQFHAINSNPAYLAASFKLSADLDFNPYSLGLTSNTLPAQFTCLEYGSNFMPLGYAGATCNTTTKVMTWGAITNFTGTFDGGNFQIKNLRLRAEDKDFIGMFAKLHTTLQDFGNFHLENAEISGSNYVGALAGLITSPLTGTNQTMIWSVTAKNVDVEARGNAAQSNVGGIAGRMENGNLFRVNLKTSKVRGEGSRVGGVIGSTVNVLLKEVASEVDIENNSPLPGKIDIGGVVGHADNSDFYYVKHEGGIYTDAHQVGGIVGSTVANSRIQNFYTISHIVTNSSDPNSKVGGVIGLWGSNAASPVGPGYSLSKVRTRCPAFGSCTQGAIVGSVTTEPSTHFNMYRPNDLDSGAGDIPTTFASNEVIINAIADFRNTTNTPVLNTDTVGAYNWEILNGEYPRFDFELHPCVKGASGLGGGTLVSPTYICNEGQYTAMTGNFYKLLANIRFSENSSDNDIVTFNGHLNGDGHALIAGNAPVSGNDGLGHIGTLNGSIRNLKIHGMSRSTNSPTPAIPHGALVATNNGTLENIKIWSYADFWAKGSGVVGHNSLAGEMRKIHFDGILKGHDYLAALTYFNQGLIEHSRASGEIQCTASTACNYLAGLAITNQGRIKKTEMSVRLSEPSTGIANYVSMLVDSNTYVSIVLPALIQDVSISEHAEFKTSGSGAYIFHRVNTGSAILQRVTNFGKFLTTEIQETFDLAVADFPFAETPATLAQAGIHVGVVRGGIYGKELIPLHTMGTCSGNIFTLSSWSTIGAAGWDVAYDAGVYNGLGNANKKFILYFELPSGQKSFHQVTAFNGTNSEFTIATVGLCVGGKMALYWTDDLPMQPGTSTPSGGYILPQGAGVLANYPGTFTANTWDTDNNPADLVDLLNYYKFVLGFSPVVVTPKPWEITEDGIELTNDITH